MPAFLSLCQIRMAAQQKCGGVKKNKQRWPISVAKKPHRLLRAQKRRSSNGKPEKHQCIGARFAVTWKTPSRKLQKPTRPTEPG